MREKILNEAKEIETEIIKHRRYLHKHAEVGFNITKTLAYVEKELKDMGYTPIHCGKAGLIATIQGKKAGKVFLIRSDMDALPIEEESGVDFASTNHCMHACGHDMHTAMLLGAAKLLKKHAHQINGTIKLMFQASEETFEGSYDMIQNGVLENPKVDAALMIHVMANTPFKPGTAIVSSPGVSAPAADYFEIKVQGSGCHGSMPNTGIDPINVATHIFQALQTINARELSVTEKAVLTIGKFQAGTIANVIPDIAIMGGTLRTYSEDTRTLIKTRIKDIATNIAATFKAKSKVTFQSGCPTLVNDKALSNSISKYTKNLLGNDYSFTVDELNQMTNSGETSKSAGSEDFAYISQEVPSIMIALAAGQPEQGYCYPQHHPKVKFDETSLSYGSAIYAYTAIEWLKEH